MFLTLAGSLCITLFCELPVSCLFHARGKDILLVILVNVLTNPAVVLISVWTGNRILIQVVLEVIAVGVEGFYYRKYSSNIRNVFLCSMCCNLFSYGAGILLK